MINVYKELEKIVLPKLEIYKEDLTKHDKELLKENKGEKFLYGYRPTGTNIQILNPKKIIGKDENKVNDRLNDDFLFLTKLNKNFLYFNGEEIKEIELGEVTYLFEEYRAKVQEYNYFIKELNIEKIALDTYYLMNSFKKSWKNAIEGNTSNSCKNLVKYFNYKKLKKPDNFDSLNPIEAMENIEVQLLNNLL